ncbi:MAG: ABC transporter substrate-binding protein, partial [Actinomycetota bacterium]|nr:ABC transporter substrate-binding protein [Actinomycetota bacterium]
HRCAQRACGRLARAVGVRALGEDRLRVRLRSSVPWFVAATAHPAFLPVPRAAVERHGREWAEPGKIVTSGPFVLAAMDEDSFTLTKNPRWRNADAVAVDNVEGRIVPNPIARVQAFDSGDVTALDGSPLPVEDIVALRERAEHELYPALGTDAYAFNLASIRDVHQRRAMAVAIDRRALVDNVAEGEKLPATRLTPAAAPELGPEEDPSPWLPPEGDVEAAKNELARAETVKRRITLLHVDAPGNRAVAAALRDAWRNLGIETVVRTRAREEYLTFRGPLSAESTDLYQVEWGLELPEAMSWLAPWTCRAARNKTNFCNPAFDRLIARARRERSAIARGELYARAEDMLTGARGAMPVIPVYWRTYSNLEALAVRDSFAVNPLGQIDFSAVEVR